MAYLFIKEGELSGTKFFLDENRVTIGRNNTNKLFINDLSVSRQHAEIRINEGKYEIIDVGSANGTFVNGERLYKNVPHILYDGDEIAIGNNTIIFYTEEGRKSTSKRATKEETKVSVIVTDEEHQGIVSATIDASKALLYDTATKTPENLISIVNRLQSMIDISLDLVTIFQPEELAEKIMAHIFDVFPKADRAFIVVWDKKKAELKPLAAQSRIGMKGKGNSFPVSRTILNTVIEKRQSIMLSDALSDSRFSSQKSIVDLSIRSLMCAPFICKDEILGVIGVDTMTRQKAFTEEDLLMLTGIASQAAIALKNAELYSALEKETKIRTQLSRYLSSDIVEGIIKGNISLKLGGEKKYGTIIFCDIVGFTTLAENLSAVDVVEKLNRYYSVVTDIVKKYKGTLHKFAGDMIMAFWNVMVPDKEASTSAIKCSLEMQNEVFLFNIALAYESQRPIYLGIG
ncbi:MAG: FHA domain-containing protein, partial [Chitinispirillaceae bacterium]|nr:FHA domain-containing protein [Chitinispirillaceae bacterium]